MTDKEYQHKRAECWKEFWKNGNLTTHNINQAFNYAFDRAYALGKQEKGAEEEDETREKRGADELNEDNFAKSDAHEDNFTSKEPKYHIGQKVRIEDDTDYGQKYRDEITEIVSVDKADLNYKVDIYDEEFGGGLWYSESVLEPYEEPKEESPNISQNIVDCDKSDCNRLKIAAMVIASIMGSNDWSDYRGGTNEEVWRNMAKAALGVADALISECGM